MESLLEVLHQNSISLRDPQAISEELDAIVRQSEDSERIVREMEVAAPKRHRRLAERPRVARAAPPVSATTPTGPEPRRSGSERSDDDAVRPLSRVGAHARARHPRPARQHVRASRQHARSACRCRRLPDDAADDRRLRAVTRFLADWVFGQRDVVIEYQRANGAIFHTRESHKHFTGRRRDRGRGARDELRRVAAARAGGRSARCSIRS